MKRLLLLPFFVTGLFAQTSNNVITLIPKTDLSATGELRFRDRQTVEHYVGFKAPDTVTANLIWKLPEADSVGCFASDGAGVLSIVSCNGLPVSDSIAIVKDDADATKLMRFEIGGFTTGVTRVLTPQDNNYILAGTDITNTFTANQLFRGYAQFAGSFGGYNWLIDGTFSNELIFRDSSANLRALFSASGAPIGIAGTSAEFYSPAIFAEATTTDSPSMTVSGFPSATADILDVILSGGTKKLWVDSSGTTHIANCVGCGGVPVSDSISIVQDDADATKLMRFEIGGFTTGVTRVLTPQDNNYILAGTDITNTFTANQLFRGYAQFAGSFGGYNWLIDGTFSNELIFRDSSANLRALFSASGAPIGIAGTSAEFYSPAIFAEATTTDSPSMTVSGFPSATADILDVILSGGSKQFTVDSAGKVNVLGPRLYVGTAAEPSGAIAADRIRVYDNTNTAADLIFIADHNSTFENAQLKLYAYTNTGPSLGGYISGLAARGTYASPTATQAGDALLTIRGGGFGTSQMDNLASISFIASTNFSGSNGETYMVFYTTIPGATSQSEAMRITSGGRLLVGSSADDGTGAFIQTNSLISASGGFYSASSADNTLNLLNGGASIRTLGVNGRGSGVTQMRVSDGGVDGGFFVTSPVSSTNEAILTGGASFDGSNWIAKSSTGAVGLDLNGSAGFGIYVNTGLTNGASYTPTLRALMNTSGHFLIGTGTDDGSGSSLQVTGGATFGAILNIGSANGFITSIIRKTANYTLANADFSVSFDTTSSTITAKLPASPATGETHRVGRVAGANALTLDGNGHNIGGTSAINVATSVIVQYDGVGWN